jgi:hypothetical protein
LQNTFWLTCKKKDCRFHLRLGITEDISAHGGQLLMDCLAKRVDV